MEHIPLFMTRSPDEIDPEKAPALAALQDIKYEEETPQGTGSGERGGSLVGQTGLRE